MDCGAAVSVYIYSTGHSVNGYTPLHISQLLWYDVYDMDPEEINVLI